MAVNGTFFKSLPSCLDIIFNNIDCNDSIPLCRNPNGFVFQDIWSITTKYAAVCPNGAWLFPRPQGSGPSHQGLTNAACKAMTGNGWTVYPGSDIWNRLTAWKFPLFQLVANSPRTPLGFAEEAFQFVHFLGDPISVIADLLRKIDGCQTRAVFWKEKLETTGESELAVLRDERTELERTRLWKSLAIIVDSFDEWGLEVGDEAESYLLDELKRLCLPETSPYLRHKYIGITLQTADALAADRSTKFLPVVIAQAFFIGSIAISMIRTKSSSSGDNPTMFINIEMYSIAFTAQFFWVIFAVVWTSIIGTSQTTAAIPRILRRFRRDLTKQLSEYNLVVKLPINRLTATRRIYCGGIYMWQPARKWKTAGHNSTLETHQPDPEKIAAQSALTRKLETLTKATVLRYWPIIHFLLPFIVVAAAASTGQLLSALVPPTGWSCRSTGMLWIVTAWLASYMLSLIPFGNNHTSHFYFTFAKDFAALAATFGLVIATQVGIYNRCDCYTSFGRLPLQLPFMPAVADTLRTRLADAYPAVVALGIAVQLVLLPALLVWRYHAAVRVFLQRDDGSSNLDWWHVFQQWRRTKLYSGRGGGASGRVRSSAVVPADEEAATALTGEEPAIARAL